MFKTSLDSITSTATALIGTAFIAAAFVGIASPARAATPAGFQKTVEAQISKTLRFPVGVTSQAQGVATVAVSVNADGTVSDASIARSSGTRAFDREAIRTAKLVRYPATGAARSVAMVLSFGQTPDSVDTAAAKAIVNAYRTDHRQLLATETRAKPAG
jgi:TonB family protein